MISSCKKALIDTLIVLQSVVDTYEVQTDDPPWSHNPTMVDCVKGTWLETPRRVSNLQHQILDLLDKIDDFESNNC